MCLFHKYELVETVNTTEDSFIANIKIASQPILCILSRCSKCKKEKAVIKRFDGCGDEPLDPFWFKTTREPFRKYPYHPS